MSNLFHTEGHITTIIQHNIRLMKKTPADTAATELQNDE